jgi:outer membrane protein assembly factor BamB
VYNDNIVVPTTNGDNIRQLSMLNSKDGKILWKWNDLFEEGTEYMDIAFHYQYKNLLAYQYGSRSYCINLDNGSTQWRIRRDKRFDVRIDPFGQHYFIYTSVTNSDGYDEQIAFKGDLQNGSISEFLTANFTYEHPDCVRGVLSVTQVPEHDNLLLVSYAENLPDWIAQSYFGLYDTDLKEWVWDKVLIAPPALGKCLYYAPKIVNGKVYAEISNSIVCHDLNTGKQLWKRDFINDFTFSGFIIEDGRLIANNEDLFTICLDPETGNELWRVNTSGTCGKMSYLNGIVYFVGGSVPRLFAIEASTGKILWRIDAERLGEGYGAWFRPNAVYVLPAKNDQPAKVIALSDLYAYCFEAYR